MGCYRYLPYFLLQRALHACITYLACGPEVRGCNSKTKENYLLERKLVPNTSCHNVSRLKNESHVFFMRIYRGVIGVLVSATFSRPAFSLSFRGIYGGGETAVHSAPFGPNFPPLVNKSLPPLLEVSKRANLVGCKPLCLPS